MGDSSRFGDITLMCRAFAAIIMGQKVPRVYAEIFLLSLYIYDALQR